MRYDDGMELGLGLLGLASDEIYESVIDLGSFLKMRRLDDHLHIHVQFADELQDESLGIRALWSVYCTSFG